MANTTIGVKLDDAVRTRIKDAALTQGRTSHALIKSSILTALDRHERGLGEASATAARAPFLDFARELQPQSVLRAKVTAAYR